MAGRNSQVSRIYRILTLLEHHHFGMTVGELWRRLSDQNYDVVERTIYRDLQALEQAGFPLAQKGRNTDGASRWVLESASAVPQTLVMKPLEVMALYLSRRALAPLQGLPFYEDLMGLLDKLKDRLGPRKSIYYEELQADLMFESQAPWATGIQREVVEAVHAACSEGQVLEVLYTSVNSRSNRLRRLGPHYLYFTKSSLYLVAEDLNDHVVKTFALPRIQSAELLDEPYVGARTTPDDQRFQSSIGVFSAGPPERIRLRFRAPLAAFASERIWHHSQELLYRSDECTELGFFLGRSPELVQWILSFGRHADVLEPAVLREEVRAEALALAANNGSDVVCEPGVVMVKVS